MPGSLGARYRSTLPEAKASSPFVPEPPICGCSTSLCPGGATSLSSTGMSATAPARTVMLSATAIAPPSLVSGTWKTVSRAIATRPPSSTAISAEPILPAAPSGVLPETRTCA